MRLLITGAKSGLGRHCLDYFTSQGHQIDAYTRETQWLDIQDKPYDLIIHSAFNARKDITANELSDYLDDNLFLTQKLTQLSHKKFIFISSIDVYPKTSSFSEDEIIKIAELDNIYAISKLMCEALVQKYCSDFLILRPSALLGKSAKPNSLIKLFTHDSVKISLAKTSTFNYLLHDDVSTFIDVAIKENLQGIYNLAVAKNISLLDVATNFCIQTQIEFGNYVYTTGTINQSKAMQYFADLSRASLDTIRLFRQKYSHARS